MVSLPQIAAAEQEMHMPEYTGTVCATPAGPCVTAKGPDPWAVAGMLLLTVGAGFVAYTVIDNLDQPKPRRRVAARTR
jgi:hypothetical protein